MFGYVACNKSKMTPLERERYQGVYCGLCKTLKTRHGPWERMSLNYDMTFLALFLNSLYEPPEKEEEFRCMFHPAKKKKAMCSRYTDYAADMTVALAYHKCLDDWNDEHKRAARRYAGKIADNYQKILKKYPRQCGTVENEIARLTALEKKGTALADEAINCSGRMLAEIFVYSEDFWSGSLRRFGYHLGRFIYLMDAAIDYKKDRKTGNYNPLFLINKKPEEAEPFLQSMIGEAAYEFEKLPIVRDVNLLRGIIYGGVWQQYYLKYRKEGSSHD